MFNTGKREMMMAGFKDILGNEHILDHFNKAIENEKVSHAYIINGEKGMGKKTLAKTFAMTLLCEEKGRQPCLKCHSCIQALTDNNPDIIYVKHEKANLISVDEIRSQFVNDVDLKPYSYERKVYIIEDAQLMNVQAQNAMLKTIEEPPAYTVALLLTTNVDSMLQTVLSRCITLNMQPLKKEAVKKYLMEKDNVTDYQAEIAVSFAGGNLGKAKSLVSSAEFSEMLEEVIQVLKYIKDMQAYEMVAAVKRAADYKYTFHEYIDLIILWFRDVLLYKASMNIDGLIFKNELKIIKQHAANSSYNGIQEILEALDKAKLRLKSNVNFDLTIELMFITIRDNI